MPRVRPAVQIDAAEFVPHLFIMDVEVDVQTVAGLAGVGRADVGIGDVTVDERGPWWRPAAAWNEVGPEPDPWLDRHRPATAGQTGAAAGSKQQSW